MGLGGVLRGSNVSLSLSLSLSFLSKKQKDYLEKAISAFNKEVRCNQHKVHLLCLMARGLYLSRQCDDVIKQSLLFSLIGADSKYLVHDDVEKYDQASVLKILKWVASKTSELHQTLRKSTPEDEDYQFSDVQILVTLLRALGLRTRLVMVLNPVSFKENKSSVKRKSVDMGEKTQSKSDGGKNEDNGETSKLKTESAEDVSSETIRKARRKRRRSALEKDVSSPPSPSSSSSQPQRKSRRQPQTSKQRRCSEGATTSKNSPYFKKQAKSSPYSPYFQKQVETKRKSSQTRESAGNIEEEQSSGSDSEYVPEEKIKSKRRNLSSSLSSKNVEDSDDDFQQPKKKRRRSSQVVAVSPAPAKKLKEAVKRTKDKSSKSPLKGGASERRADSDVVCVGSSSNESRGCSEGVEVVKCEETGSWAEVYLSAEGGESRAEKVTKKWSCVHLPSCSIDQRHLCEKQCSLPLNYVIAIEKGEHRIVLCSYAEEVEHTSLIFIPCGVYPAQVLLTQRVDLGYGGVYCSV